MANEHDQTSALSLGTRIGIYFGWSESPERTSRGRQRLWSWQIVLYLTVLIGTGIALTIFASPSWGGPFICGGLVVATLRIASSLNRVERVRHLWERAAAVWELERDSVD